MLRESPDLGNAVPVSSCDGIGDAALQSFHSVSMRVHCGFPSIPSSYKRRLGISAATTSAQDVSVCVWAFVHVVSVGAGVGRVCVCGQSLCVLSVCVCGVCVYGVIVHCGSKGAAFIQNV